MSLSTRKIGNDNVPEIGFGVASLCVSSQSEEEKFKVLNTAVEEGCTFWDTADMYGDNEELLGRWFKQTGKRDSIFLATKFGFVLDKIQQGIINGRPEYVKAAAELSLKKLGVDFIDLYYMHRVDPEVPIETTVGAMADLVKAGKVRYLGLSEVSATTLRRAHAVHPITAVEVEYSPFCLEIESENIGILEACRELGIAVVAYSPLGRGILTGTIRSYDDFPEGDIKPMLPRYSKEDFPKILKLVDGIQEIAKKRDSTSGQVTLAWLLAQGNNVIPIPGTKSIKYLKENIGAVKVKLSDEEVKQVRELAEQAEAVLGARYPPQFMRLAYADTPPLSS